MLNISASQALAMSIVSLQHKSQLFSKMHQELETEIMKSVNNGIFNATLTVSYIDSLGEKNFIEVREAFVASVRSKGYSVELLSFSENHQKFRIGWGAHLLTSAT